MADCFRVACLLVLAGVWGVGYSPASSTEILTPIHGNPARESAKDASTAWNDLNLTIRADRQSVDLQQNRLVAEGNVRLHLAGGHLAAERVTYGRGTGLLTATGAVRFRRGSQYIQAGSLRYNLENREGELRDVYGVINLDHHTADLDFRVSPVRPTSRTKAVDPDEPWVELPPMACPVLLRPLGTPARAVGRATQGRQSLVPPLGCPNPDGHARYHQDLDSLPAGVSGSGPAPPELDSQRSGPVDQRVYGITSRTGLQREYHLDFQDRYRSGETENEEEGEDREDPVIPAAFGILERSLEPDQTRGGISHWRFQAEAVFLTPEAWTSPLVVLTNDPLTPAQLILEGRDSQVREQSDGSLILTSATNRGLLDGRLSVPLPRRIALDSSRPSWALLSDRNRRDGVYIERTLAPHSVLGGELILSPQLMLGRALSGTTDAYPPGHSSPEAEPVRQVISVGDLFGLDVRYRRPVGPQGQLRLRADFSTLSPHHVPNRTRAEANLSHPLTLPLLGETKATLSAAYHFSVWNGSLGEQDVYTAFGGFLEKDYQFPQLGSVRNRLLWRLGLQNINTTVFDTKDLSGNTWRASGYVRLTSTLPIWQGEILEDSTQALRYVPRPIRPEVSLTTFSIAHSSSYDDHSGQRYYTLGILSDVAMGHFSRPYLDYTKLSIGGSVSAVEQISRFGFDRAIDLGLLHISWTQQLVGPLLLSTSMSYNVDGRSEKYGHRIDSLFEIKWQRRAYNVGIFHSPERGLTGLRIRINGFDWRGTGTPFIPYTPSSWLHDNR